MSLVMSLVTREARQNFIHNNNQSATRTSERVTPSLWNLNCSRGHGRKPSYICFSLFNLCYRQDPCVQTQLNERAM